MSEGGVPPGNVTSVDELAIGDGIYSEASESPYWVSKITDRKVVLLDKDDSPHAWVRGTLDASMESHTWIRQSGPSLGREADPER